MYNLWINTIFNALNHLRSHQVEKCERYELSRYSLPEKVKNSCAKPAQLVISTRCSLNEFCLWILHNFSLT